MSKTCHKEFKCQIMVSAVLLVKSCQLTDIAKTKTKLTYLKIIWNLLKFFLSIRFTFSRCSKNID